MPPSRQSLQLKALMRAADHKSRRKRHAGGQISDNPAGVESKHTPQPEGVQPCSSSGGATSSINAQSDAYPVAGASSQAPAQGTAGVKNADGMTPAQQVAASPKATSSCAGIPLVVATAVSGARGVQSKARVLAISSAPVTPGGGAALASEGVADDAAATPPANPPNPVDATCAPLPSASSPAAAGAKARMERPESRSRAPGRHGEQDARRQQLRRDAAMLANSNAPPSTRSATGRFHPQPERRVEMWMTDPHSNVDFLAPHGAPDNDRRLKEASWMPALSFMESLRQYGQTPLGICRYEGNTNTSHYGSNSADGGEPSGQPQHIESNLRMRLGIAPAEEVWKPRQLQQEWCTPDDHAAGTERLRAASRAPFTSASWPATRPAATWNFASPAQKWTFHADEYRPQACGWGGQEVGHGLPTTAPLPAPSRRRVPSSADRRDNAPGRAAGRPRGPRTSYATPTAAGAAASRRPTFRQGGAVLFDVAASTRAGPAKHGRPTPLLRPGRPSSSCSSSSATATTVLGSAVGVHASASTPLRRGGPAAGAQATSTADDPITFDNFVVMKNMYLKLLTETRRQPQNRRRLALAV